jgi:hypothetical protein
MWAYGAAELVTAWLGICCYRRTDYIARGTIYGRYGLFGDGSVVGGRHGSIGIISVVLNYCAPSPATAWLGLRWCYDRDVVRGNTSFTGSRGALRGCSRLFVVPLPFFFVADVNACRGRKRCNISRRQPA